MEISVFSIKRKLGGIFASHERVMADLERDMVLARRWHSLRNHPDWSIMREFLTRIHDEAIQGFAQNEIPDNKRVWLNSRLQLLQEIENEGLTAIKRGDLAQGRYQKIQDKEERNARKQRPTN